MYEPYYPYHQPVYRSRPVRGYGLSNLVGDLTLFGATFGLWGIWIVVREIRLAG